MKRRMRLFLAAAMILSLTITAAVPGFAAEKKYEDPAVEAAYQAYLVLKAARDAETKDVDALREAMENQEEINGGIEWEDLDILPEDFFAVLTESSSVIRFDKVRSAFLAEKNAKTAGELLEMADIIKEGGYTELVKSFFGDFDKLYEDAKKAGPSAKTKAVYEAFYYLNSELEMAFWPDELAARVNEFKKVESQFKSLTYKELEDVALLLDIDLEPAAMKVHINDVVKRSQDAVKILDTYNSFSEMHFGGEADVKNLTKTGKEYVRIYDQVMASADDAQTMIMYALYGDLDYLYNQAKVYTLPEKALNVYTGIKEFREVLFGEGIEVFEAGAVKFETEVLPLLEQVKDADLDVAAAALDFADGAGMKEELNYQLERMKEEVETGKVLKETIPEMKFRLKSAKTTLRGKKAVKLTWEAPDGVEFDGYQIFRSTKKYSGYGTEPVYETMQTSYTNNKGIEKGNTYYYKVRGYKYICNELVYTDWSYKAWRKF